MGLFDGVSKKSGVVIGNNFLSHKPVTTESKKELPAEVIQQRKLALEKHNNALADINSKNLVKQEATFFPGSVKTRDSIGNIPVTVENKFSTRPEVEKYLRTAKYAFEEVLGDRLIMETISIIITEACPIPDEIRSKEPIKAYIAEMAYDIYSKLKPVCNFESKDYKFPSFIQDLAEEAKEVASLEAAERFDYDTVTKECGLEIAKINTYVQEEVSLVSVQNDRLNTQFSAYAATIVLENLDIIEKIKNKVSGEIEKYKQTAQKIASAKEEIESSTKADPLNKDQGDANGEEQKTEADAGAGSGTEPGASADTSAGTEGTGGNPGEGKEELAGKKEGDSGNAGETGEELKKEEGASTATDGTTEKQSDVESSTKPTTESDGTTDGGEQGVKTPLTIAEEIEDASSFAQANNHTFNTGSEKFEKIHEKISLQLVDAVSSGNLDEMATLQANSKSAADALRTISDSSNKKYSDTLQKMDDLTKNISFEINKAIQGKVTTTESARTIFDNLVLNIGTRYKERFTMEGYTPEVAITKIPGEQVVQEATIYLTTLETFHTLRFLDFQNTSVRRMFREFIGKIAA